MQEAARANVAAAKKSGDAWAASQERIKRIEGRLPSLLGNRPGGLWHRFQTDGALSFLFGGVRRLGSLVGTVFGIAGTVRRRAFGAPSGAAGVVCSLAGGAARAAGGIVRMGASAATAAGRLALNLGAGAVALLGRLGGAAASTALKIAGIARRLVVRAAFVGTGAAVAGFGLACKAVADSAQASRETFNGALDTRTGLGNYQALTGAVKRAGLDMGEFNAALSTAKGKMEDLASDPEPMAYFNRLGVGTRHWNGSLRDTSSVLQDLIGVRTRVNAGGQHALALRRQSGAAQRNPEPTCDARLMQSVTLGRRFRVRLRRPGMTPRV